MPDVLGTLSDSPQLTATCCCSGVMLENAGIPLPGETAALRGRLPGGEAAGGTCTSGWSSWCIRAAVTGDNLGYWLGRSIARPRLARASVSSSSPPPSATGRVVFPPIRGEDRLLRPVRGTVADRGGSGGGCRGDAVGAVLPRQRLRCRDLGDRDCDPRLRGGPGVGSDAAVARMGRVGRGGGARPRHRPLAPGRLSPPPGGTRPHRNHSACPRRDPVTV